MRKFTLLALLLSLGWGMAQNSQPEWLEKGKYVRFDDQTQLLKHIKFHPGEEINFADFDNFLRTALGMSADEEFRMYKRFQDKMGYTHYRYQQYYKGNPVEFGVFIAHVKNGRVESLNGDYFPVNPRNGAVLTRQAALNAAKAFVGADEYIWEQPGADRDLQEITGDPTATYVPFGELVVAPGGQQNWDADAFRLAYKFDIYSTRPLDRSHVYVDAENGQVIFNNPQMFAADSAGTALTYYSGTQNIITDWTGTNFRLFEAGRGGGIHTRDMNRGTNFSLAVEFTDSDNNWTTTTNKDHTANEIHWGAEGTYDYLLNYVGINSVDDNGMRMNLYAHYDNAWSNARWDGQRAMFGDGPGNNVPFGSFDVVAHELGHGVTGNSANLIYEYESGALNESYSDIIGAMVEYHYKSSPNWLIGEDLGTLRSMSNPNAKNNPDTYQGDHWEFGSFDNGGVHINSGVSNFWFYLLSMGGSGTNDNGDTYNVTGITRDSAAAIAMRNLLVYLTPRSQFVDARYYAIQAAVDLFGECSPEMVATANAWYAVGVGSEWDSIPTSEFVADETEFCTGPAFVQFTNQSTGGLSYYWIFGDFNFGTDESPLHAYNFIGTYSPKLVTTGCNNVKDTMEKVNYIVLDQNLPCTYTMPSSGVGPEYDDCNGRLKDSGGNGNYLSNVTGITTIAPAGASQVVLTFSLFDFETSGDALLIYDGNSVGAPLIGAYNGSSLPGGGTITSTGPAITLKEQTNGANEKAGFVLEWSCLVNNELAQNENEWSVYPNPATGSFFVEYNFSGADKFKITVADAMGKTLFTENVDGNGFLRKEISTSGWASGMYFVNIEGANKVLTKKLMVK